VREREVLVVVRRETQFLVLHRSPRFEAYWHLVAGGVEEGEVPLDAALRELHEEVALDARGALEDLEQPFAYSLVDESDAVRARFAERQTEVPVDVFVADAAPGWEPTLNDEHDDYRWATAEEAEALLFWPEPRAVVRRLAQTPRE
jgi:8-oxo-dGTP pyrophosphatase MutT (NUDIX family)